MSIAHSPASGASSSDCHAGTTRSSRGTRVTLATSVKQLTPDATCFGFRDSANDSFGEYRRPPPPRSPAPGTVTRIGVMVGAVSLLFHSVYFIFFILYFVFFCSGIFGTCIVGMHMIQVELGQLLWLQLFLKTRYF